MKPVTLKTFLCLALLVTTVLVYAPVAENQFITYDDDTYVVNNEMVTAGLTKAGIVDAFTNTREANWHPLTWMSHMLDCQLYGLAPQGHHLTNLLLHLLNTVLLFCLLHRLTGSLWRPAFVAALFALHPLHVESVAWVAERKDVLSALFWMLALLSYSSYVTSPSFPRYFMSLCLFALGLMAKPMVVTLPFVMLLLDFWPLARLHRGSNYRLIREKIPFFVLSMMASLVAIFAQHGAGAMADTLNLPLTVRVANSFAAYMAYLIKALYPVHLAVFYPLHVPQYWWLVVAAVLLLVVSLLSIFLRHRYPWLLVGWLWFMGTLLPVIGIVQVGMQAMADRYTYLPLIGLFIIVVWGFAEVIFKQSGCVGMATAVVVIMILACLSRRQVSYWRDSITLFSHAIAVTDDNFMMHHNLADALDRQGRYDEAVEHLKETLRIRPFMAEAHYLLGNVLYKQGRLTEAEASLKMAVRIKPGYGYAHNNLGVVLAAQGRQDEAAAEYGEALSINPDDREARQNLDSVMGRAASKAGH